MFYILSKNINVKIEIPSALTGCTKIQIAYQKQLSICGASPVPFGCYSGRFYVHVHFNIVWVGNHDHNFDRHSTIPQHVTVQCLSEHENLLFLEFIFISNIEILFYDQNYKYWSYFLLIFR